MRYGCKEVDVMDDAWEPRCVENSITMHGHARVEGMDVKGT